MLGWHCFFERFVLGLFCGVRLISGLVLDWIRLESSGFDLERRGKWGEAGFVAVDRVCDV